jgi:hypothetical protein
MRRDKYLADHNVLAASAGQTADEPIVDDLAIADRQQKEGPSCGCFVSGGVMRPPSLAQLAISQPLANDQVPLNR